MTHRLRALAMAAALAPTVLVARPVQADAPPIEAFGKLPDVDNVQISPSGKRFAFVGTTPLGRIVFISEEGKPLMRELLIDAKADNGKAIKQAKIESLVFPDEDHVLVEIHKTVDLTDGPAAKHEFHEVGILNLTTRKLSWVFGMESSILHNVVGSYGYVRKDGHSYGFFSGQVIDHTGLTNDVNLFRVDLDSGKVVHAALGEKENFDFDWVVGSDATVLARVEFERRSRQWRLYDETHRGLLAEGKDPYGGASLLGLGRTPDTIVYQAPDATGAAHDYETALTPGSTQTPVFDDVLTTGLLFDRTNGRLAGAVLAGDYPDVVFLDPKRETAWKEIKAAFPAGSNISFVSADDAFDRLIVYTEGAGDAGTFWFVDLKTPKVDRFADAYPGVPATAIGPRKVIDYKAADGLQLHGILTLPAGRDPKGLPVIVFPHGGPHARDYLGFDWWAEALASRGYAVFQPNFRGSSGYGYDFAHAGFGEWGRKMQTDISDGLKYLADQGLVDPKRACIVGASYGGYAALAGVTVQQGLYRCAVSVAGVSDLRVMLSDEAGKSTFTVESPEVRYWKDMMGAKGLSDGALRDISPADLARNADAPILLIHGKDDTTVPIEQSRIMERALKGAGKPVEFVVLDSEDHYLSRQPTRIAMLQALVAFVEKYDPPK